MDDLDRGFRQAPAKFSFVTAEIADETKSSQMSEPEERTEVAIEHPAHHGQLLESIEAGQRAEARDRFIAESYDEGTKAAELCEAVQAEALRWAVDPQSIKGECAQRTEVVDARGIEEQVPKRGHRLDSVQ